MNILLLSQEYPPESAMGGVGTYMHSMAHAYARIGHNVHVVSSAAPGQATYDSLQDRVHVHRIRRWKFQVPLLRRVWLNAAPWTKHQLEYAIGACKELTRIVSTYQIEVIEATELWAEGFFYSYARQAPIVVKLHTPLFVLRALNQMRPTLDWDIVDHVDKWWTLRADQIVSTSASLAQLVAERYHLDAKKIPVIPEPVDTNYFLPRTVANGSSRVIMYLGQLEPRKGIFTVADAIPRVLQQFPDARFQFVGGDRVFNGKSSRRVLEERLDALGVAQNADLVGKIPNQELGDFFERAAVCLFPSKWENFAIACLEAMASARPVIASDAGGFREMIENEKSGILVPPENSEALARAIVRVLENPNAAHSLGLRARQRVQENFSVEIIAQRNLELYAQTIEKWRARKNG